MRRRARTAIGVWAHINGLNQGDDLVVETVLDALSRRDRSDLFTVSMYPEGSVERHGVPSFPIGALPPGESRRHWVRSLPGPLARAQQLLRRVAAEATAVGRSLTLLRKCRTLVIAGSGPLEDDPGSAYRLAKWVVLARLAGAKVAILSVGAGPLDRTVNQVFVRVALRLSNYASVRDRSSAELLRTIGHRGAVAEKPDMGWAWPRITSGAATADRRPRRVVGVNVMSLNDPRYERGIAIEEADWGRFHAYTAKLSEFIDHCVSTDNDVVLFSTESHHDVRVRQEVLDELVRRGSCDNTRVSLQEDTSVEGMLDTIRECDLVIATRFHAALVALASGKATIGLGYHPKTADLFGRLGIPSYCLNASDFSSESLVTVLDAVTAEWDDVAESVREAVESLRGEVEDQFDLVADL